MKLIFKTTALLLLAVLASPVFILSGCGVLNGDASGLCPDSVAPQGAQINKPTIGAPSTTNNMCFSGLGFKVVDSSGQGMNNICVVVTTNAAVAVTTENDFICANAAISPKAQIVTRTDRYGNVILDLLTPVTTAGTTFFVEVASGSLSVVATTQPAI